MQTPSPNEYLFPFSRISLPDNLIVAGYIWLVRPDVPVEEGGSYNISLSIYSGQGSGEMWIVYMIWKNPDNNNTSVDVVFVIWEGFYLLAVNVGNWPMSVQPHTWAI